MKRAHQLMSDQVSYYPNYPISCSSQRPHGYLGRRNNSLCTSSRIRTRRARVPLAIHQVGGETTLTAGVFFIAFAKSVLTRRVSGASGGGPLAWKSRHVHQPAPPPLEVHDDASAPDLRRLKPTRRCADGNGWLSVSIWVGWCA